MLETDYVSAINVHIHAVTRSKVCRRHMRTKLKELTLEFGEVELIQIWERKGGKRKTGIVVKLKGRDGVVQVARLRGEKSYLERVVQHLCSVELSCNVRKMQVLQQVQLNPQAERSPQDEQR